MKEEQAQKKSKKQKMDDKKKLTIFIIITIVLGVCLFTLGAFMISDKYVDKSINNDNANDNANESNSESSSDAQNNVTVNNSNNCVQINGSSGAGCAVSFEEKDDYNILFYKSGLKLNLGSGYEFINLEYNADIYKETVYIGGMTLNNGRAQNTPAFAEGTGRRRKGDGYEYWDWLARIDIYDAERWYGPHGYEGVAYKEVLDGEMPQYEIVLSNYGYVAVYYAQPELIDIMQWQTDWETETINALGQRIRQVDNWSRYK